MKYPTLILMLAGAAAAAPPVLPPVTTETLAKLQAMDPMARYERPAATTPATAERPSIISQSALLHDGTHWTLVPAGALIHVPDALKSRVATAPTGKLLPWLDFLAYNRSWLSTTEVSIEQASGKNPLPAERLSFWQQQDKIIIAVHRGGPISLRMPESEPLASNP